MILRPPSGPPQSDLVAVLGALFSAASILIVFQMFALQSWYSRTQSLDDASFDLDQRTVVGAIERVTLIHRIRSHRRAFPWIQLGGLGFGVLALLTLASFLATSVTELAWYFTLGPVVILGATFLGINVAVMWGGRKMLNEAAQRIK